MNIANIRTALHLDSLISKRKSNPVNLEKIVKIIDSSIPGDSYEQLTTHKDEIARFAKEKGLLDVVFYDPRRNLGEFFSLNVESRMANCVGLRAKNKTGISQNKSIDFFSTQRSEFMSKVYEKLSDAANFINSPMLSTITIDSSIAKNMSRRSLKKFQTKVMKEAETAKISNIEVTTTMLNDKSTNVLKLSRNTDDSKSTSTYYFGDTDISHKDVLKKIKEFDGTNGINRITDYHE